MHSTNTRRVAHLSQWSNVNGVETVIACVQQVPSDKADDAEVVLGMRDVSATAETYLEAVAQVEAQVPEGWRILYVRSAGVGADAPLRGATADTASEGSDSEPTPSA